MKEELIKAYIDTNYHILPLDLVVRIDEVNPRLFFEMKKKNWHNFTIITAWNPRSVEIAHEENVSRNLRLLKDLVEGDYMLYPALGKARTNKWNPEESWCVFNIDKREAISLGNKYDQNAIVYGKLNERAKLLFCED